MMMMVIVINDQLHLVKWSSSALPFSREAGSLIGHLLPPSSGSWWWWWSTWWSTRRSTRRSWYDLDDLFIDHHLCEEEDHPHPSMMMMKAPGIVFNISSSSSLFNFFRFFDFLLFPQLSSIFCVLWLIFCGTMILWKLWCFLLISETKDPQNYLFATCTQETVLYF